MADFDDSDYSIKSERSIRHISESSNSNFSSSKYSNRRKNEHLYKQKLKEIDRNESDSDSDFVSSRKLSTKKNVKKIAQISSEDDGDDDKDENIKVYCTCKTSDVSRFMIACDNCEEWFHGDCESITQTFSKKIMNYYCVGCRKKNPMLRIQLKPQYARKDERQISVEEKPRPLPPVSQPVPKAKPAPILSGSEFELESDDEPKQKRKKKEKPQQKRKYQRKQQKPRGRTKKETGKGNKRKTTKGKNVDKNERKTTKTSRKSRNRNLSEDSEEEVKLNLPRQCFGPSCIKSARKASKYCCDECGMALAKKRIEHFVPARLSEWGTQSPYAADKLSKKELETIRKERTHALEILSDINKKQEELENIIDLGRNTSPYTEEECTEINDNEVDGDIAVSCPTCSQETTLKVALKHMEKCYNKIESRTSFCSAVKPKTENQGVFCDYLNPANGTYCKRLRLLCPEHSKDNNRITGTNDEVCGCPLRTNNDPFSDGDSFCRMLKKKCNLHYGWDKYRQASLDAQKIQQWLKLDELYERELKIMSSVNARHGLVQLLLHKTVLHPV